MKMQDRADWWEAQAQKLAEVVPQTGEYPGRGAVLDDRGLDVAAINNAADEISRFWHSSHGMKAMTLLAVSRRRIVMAVNHATSPLHRIVYYVDSTGFNQNFEPTQASTTYSGCAQQVQLTVRELVIAVVKFAGRLPDDVPPAIYEKLDDIALEIEQTVPKSD
jgi:hypothetical protein